MRSSSSGSLRVCLVFFFTFVFGWDVLTNVYKNEPCFHFVSCFHDFMKETKWKQGNIFVIINQNILTKNEKKKKTNTLSDSCFALACYAWCKFSIQR